MQRVLSVALSEGCPAGTGSPQQVLPGSLQGASARAAWLAPQLSESCLASSAALCQVTGLLRSAARS